MSEGGPEPAKEGEGHAPEKSMTEHATNASSGDGAGALEEAAVASGIEEHPQLKVSKSIRRALLIGPAGSGKSFLVNKILGREAAKHQLSASPVTLETCGHQLEDGSLEVVDTPGLNGDPAIRVRIGRDLNKRFESIHRIVIVLGKKRLEPTNIADIGAVLKVANQSEGSTGTSPVGSAAVENATLSKNYWIYFVTRIDSILWKLHSYFTIKFLVNIRPAFVVVSMSFYNAQ